MESEIIVEAEAELEAQDDHVEDLEESVIDIIETATFAENTKVDGTPCASVQNQE